MNPLTKARKERGLSCEKVAKALNINKGNYWRIENQMERGVCGASPEMADRIAKHFGNSVTRDQILFPKDYQPVADQPKTAE